MTTLVFILLLVALQRVMELVLGTCNTRRLKAEGGIENGARHYPLFILLHGSWLLAILLFTPAHQSPNRILLVLFIVFQLGRIWVIASLGRFWTTRIIILPTHPLVSKSPYRFLRHPNYVIVAVEIALLPLMFGDRIITILWSILNALLLTWRIHNENVALAAFRAVPNQI
jgi:methyltransferase